MALIFMPGLNVYLIFSKILEGEGDSSVGFSFASGERLDMGHINERE